MIGNNDAKDATYDEFGEEITPAQKETFYWTVKDDSIASTGIYSGLNLIENPGFEEVAEWSVEGSQYSPAYWTTGDATLGFLTGGSRVNTGTSLNENILNYEGNGVAMKHSAGDDAFFQEISKGKVKANTAYQVQFATWTHPDTQGTGLHTVMLGTKYEGYDLGTAQWTQSTEPWALNIVKFVFYTGDFDDSEFTYLSFKRNSGSISHFDRVTLVEEIGRAHV